MHRDYLGSILALTDADGDVIEERQFGAWGSVDRFIDSNSGTTFGHDSLLGRGYTGHEHFFEVSLIHMNGRMYDAHLGRFLSPDNFVQDPFNTQSFNRYAYVLNNPLIGADPSGELAWFIPVLIGAVIGGVSQAIKPGANFGTILGGALIGGAAGLVGFGVGNAVGGAGFFGSKAVATTMGFGAKIAGGASGGLVSGGLGTAIYGGNLGQNLLNGLVGGALGGIAPSFGGVGILPGAGLGALSGGLAGGVISELTGGSFIDGLTQGAVAGAISGGIYGGIAASKTLYDRNLLFGNLTKSGREQAFLDFSRQYNLQASGAQNIKFEDLSNAYGQTAPLDSNGKPISLAKAARNYPNGVDSEVTFGSNRMMSLKKIEANVLHERQHVIDLRAGKATQFLNASKTNMGFRGRFEVSAHRAVYNLGIQKSYNLARIKYWQQFK